MTDVIINDVLFRGDPTDTTDVWVFETIRGWYSVAESKTDLVSRPVADGVFTPVREFRRDRQIEVVAHFLGSTAESAIRAGEQLAGVLGAGVPAEITVVDAVRATSRKVSVRAVSIDDNFGGVELTATIDLVAFDPRRFGPQSCVSTGLPQAGTGLQFPLGLTGTPVEVGRNLAINPLMGAAGQGITSNSAAQMPITRGATLPTPTPDGITTGAKITRTATSPSQYAVSAYNLDGLGNVRVVGSTGVWVLVTESGYRASVSVSTAPAGVALTANVWTWVTTVAPVAANVHLAIVVTTVSGANASTTVETYVTGATTIAGATAPTVAIVPGSTGLGPNRSAAWAGTANQSEVILYETPPAPFFDWGTPGNPGRVTVENTGTAATEPEITVSGPLPGFEIVEVETGRRLRFSREVLDGQTVRLDASSGRATIGGASDVTAFLTSVEWPQIPAGATRTYQFLSTGPRTDGPQMQVCSSPAWR